MSAPITLAKSSADASLTVKLVPGWLPAEYQEFNKSAYVLPCIDEVTAHFSQYTTRYTDVQPDGRAGPGVIYLETITGGTGELVASEEPATPVVIGGKSAMYVNTGALREYRFSLADIAPGAIGVVGALGAVSSPDLEEVMDDVVGVTELGTPDPGISVSTPGTFCGRSVPPAEGGGGRNMQGTGSYTNDWSTDGANATVSKYASHVYEGNLVGVWQSILWAEGAPMKWWYQVRTCDVDGHFGEYTEYATRWWQREIGRVTDDGVVGPTTWGSADNHLRVVSGQLMYRGRYYDVSFRRASSAPGDYSWLWYASYRHTSYPAVYFDRYAC